MFCILVSPILANEGLPYKEVYIGISLCRTREIEGEKYVTLYIKPIKKVDIDKANFRLVSPDGEVEKLLIEELNKIPIKQLQHEDLDAIKEDYVLRIWVPKNNAKYAEWFLNHDFEKGSFTLTFSRNFFRNQTIEERRKEYTEKAQPQE